MSDTKRSSGNMVNMNASLWVCAEGRCEGHERDMTKWRIIWRGKLYCQTTLIDLQIPLWLLPGAAQGFVLYNPISLVRLSPANRAQDDEYISVRPWFTAAHRNPVIDAQARSTGNTVSVGASAPSALDLDDSNPFDPVCKLSGQVHTIAGVIRSA
jgi:hypothetical protein